MASSDVNEVADQLAKTKVDSGSEVSFAGKGLKLDKEEDAKPIVDAIRACQDLQALRLEGNTLGVEAAKAISKALENQAGFEKALWSDMFTGRLKSEIPQALRYLGSAIILAGAKLAVLDLSDNAFGPNGMEGLTELLKSPSCYSLKELKLHNNGLGTTGGKMLAKSLMECYRASSKAGTPLALKVFVSGRGRLENDGSIALSEPFKAMGSLEEVHMPQNGINHEGITALAGAFSCCPNLRVLNLNDNTFTERGANAMAQALPKLTKLEVLNFGDCLLKTKGVKVIAKAIRRNHTSLREVILSGNEINHIGATAVADAMENKDNLEKLDLNCNMFGEEGIELLTASMETIGKMDVLASLSDDEGTDDEDEEVEDAKGSEDEGVCVTGEEGRDDQQGEQVDDPKLAVQGVAITPRTPDKPVKAEDFLAFPSPTKLCQMGQKRADTLIQHLGEDVKQVDKAIQTVIKVASVVTSDDQETLDAACQCADAIFSRVFTEGGENVAASVSNAILVYLGLLKGEDKIKPPSNISGPLIVLEHVVRQKYFPKLTKDILQVFIGRPHQLLQSSSKNSHKLLQALYQS